MIWCCLLTIITIVIIPGIIVGLNFLIKWYKNRVYDSVKFVLLTELLEDIERVPLFYDNVSSREEFDNYTLEYVLTKYKNQILNYIDYYDKLEIEYRTSRIDEMPFSEYKDIRKKELNLIKKVQSKNCGNIITFRCFLNDWSRKPLNKELTISLEEARVYYYDFG